MTGILLINMGSPVCRCDMKTFLNNMFNDKAILPMPSIPRKLVAKIISTTRYKGSWDKYKLIGGSPLMKSMDEIKEALAAELGSDYYVSNAYSYSTPSVAQGVQLQYNQGIREMIAIPVYPQYSISTSESVITDLRNANKSFKDMNIRIAGSFYNDPNYIEYWTGQIQKSIEEKKLTKPHLLFSGHAIPEYLIQKGDTYVQEISESARLISKKLGLTHDISFQSKIGRVKWVGPDTKDKLKELAQQGISEILIIPISFINENLETLYDLDVEIVPYGRNELGLKNLHRSNIPKNIKPLVETFKAAIQKIEL
ncbi:MAG: ferrochelatase [Paludibacter sp.]|nr:ferrochelatase [Paludibacter sp.]